MKSDVIIICRPNSDFPTWWFRVVKTHIVTQGSKNKKARQKLHGLYDLTLKVRLLYLPYFIDLNDMKST